MSFLSRLGPPTRPAQGRLRPRLDGADDPSHRAAPDREDAGPRDPAQDAPPQHGDRHPRSAARAEALWFEAVRQPDPNMFGGFSAEQDGLRTAQILRAVGEMSALGRYARPAPAGVSGEILGADDIGGEGARVIDADDGHHNRGSP